MPKSYVKSKFWPSDSDSPAIGPWTCSQSEISDSDRTFNQILKATILLLSLIAKGSMSQQELSKLSSVYAEITAVCANEIRWGRVLQHEMEDRWKDLLPMSRFFLNWVNLIKTTGESVEEYSLFVDMNQLFDAYIVALVKRIDEDFEDLTDGKLDFYYRDEDDCTLTVMRTREIPSDYDPCIDFGYKGEREQVIDPRWKKIETLNDSDINRMQNKWAFFDSPQTVLLYPHSGDFGGKEGSQKIVWIEHTDFWDNKHELATINVADGSQEVNRLQKILNNLNYCDNVEELRNWQNSVD